MRIDVSARGHEWPGQRHCFVIMRLPPFPAIGGARAGKHTNCTADHIGSAAHVHCRLNRPTGL